ncbi:MAG: hypothetical protein LBJ12_01625 [Oscillospiraceae bacterium]|nr:hypothetical protein [Oscillospiraceae bacterium]
MHFLSKTQPRSGFVRIAALALCFVFAAAVLLSAAFITTHANHTHDVTGADGSCTVCIQLVHVQTMLKQLSTGIALSVAAIFALFAILGILRIIKAYTSAHSPVGLKVKLNN